jgi:DNA-directed RNA polymerase specialized sigma24 family protein
MSEVLDPPASAPPAHREARIDEAEHEILASIAAGDRVAMERIYLRYFARLANFLRRLGVRADFIEESINDIMIEVWRGSASLGADVSVAVAIMRLAYSRERKRSASTDNTPPGTPALESEWPELPAVWRLAPKRRHFLPTLSIEESALLHLVYACGHSRREVAEIMGLSCECVDLLLAEARIKYRLLCA